MGNKSEMLGWIDFQEERIYKDISTHKNLLIALRILREEFWHKETLLVFSPLKNKWKSRWLQSTVSLSLLVPRPSWDSWSHWSQCFEYYSLKVAGVPSDKSADLSKFKPDFCFDDSGSYPAVNTSSQYCKFNGRCTENHTKHTNFCCVQKKRRIWNIKPGGTQSDHWALQV